MDARIKTEQSSITLESGGVSVALLENGTDLVVRVDAGSAQFRHVVARPEKAVRQELEASMGDLVERIRQSVIHHRVADMRELAKATGIKLGKARTLRPIIEAIMSEVEASDEARRVEILRASEQVGR